MENTSWRVSRPRAILVGVLCVGLGFVGGIVGAQTRTVEPAQSTPGVVSTDIALKGVARTTVPTSTTTVKPSAITVPKTLPGQPGPPGPQGPIGPAGPTGPAGKDGIGFKSIQWVEGGGSFEGCCGVWIVSCPSGTTAISWQIRQLDGAKISYTGSISANLPNEWRFNAVDDRSSLDFSTPLARFALGCVTFG